MKKKDVIMLYADITREQREEFKKLAKARGMTLSGLLGKMIEKELKKEN